MLVSSGASRMVGSLPPGGSGKTENPFREGRGLCGAVAGKQGLENLVRRGKGRALCLPCQGLPPALLPGSRNQLKGNRKGEKESKQSQRKAWSLEHCLVWRSHLLGHSQQHCTRTPQAPHTRAHTCTHAHIHICTHTCTHTQIQTHIHSCTQACRHAQMHRYTHRNTHMCIVTPTYTHAHKTDIRTHAHTWCGSSSQRAGAEMEGFWNPWLSPLLQPQ